MTDPECRHAVVGAEVSYGAVHHGQMILRNGGNFAQAARERSTYKNKNNKHKLSCLQDVKPEPPF